MTEIDIAEELVKTGVPKEDIILGLHHLISVHIPTRELLKIKLPDRYSNKTEAQSLQLREQESQQAEDAIAQLDQKQQRYQSL